MAAAAQAADSAFGRPSTLSLEQGSSIASSEQEGRRRLTDSYLIDIDRIVPDPEQPRRTFEESEMSELTESVRARGLKQPLTVRWVQQLERYMIVDGGRRYAAAKRAGLEELPCWIQHVEGKEVLIDQIVHNWQRVELRPYETADALARLRDEFGLSQQQLAAVTGKPKGEVSKLLALHDKVVPEVRNMAREDVQGTLTKRHLYNISKLPGEQQRKVAEQVQRGRLTALETEQLTTKSRSKDGLAARQRRFHTETADVILTFRKVDHTDDDVLDVIDTVRQQLSG